MDDAHAKPKKKLVGFALARSNDDELKQMYDDMNSSLAAAAAKAPIE